MLISLIVLLSFGLLLLFLLRGFGCFLLCRLGLLFLLLFGCFLLCRFGLLFLFLWLGLFLFCSLWLLFLFLWFGLFLLRSRFCLFLMLRWLSALFLVLFLRERRNTRSEKQEHSRCADDSEYFHAC